MSDKRLAESAKVFVVPNIAHMASPTRHTWNIREIKSEVFRILTVIYQHYCRLCSSSLHGLVEILKLCSNGRFIRLLGRSSFDICVIATIKHDHSAGALEGSSGET